MNIDPTMSVEDSINDERIIVTDEFIRELEKEIQMDNTFLHGNIEQNILIEKKIFRIKLVKSIMLLLLNY